MRNMLTGALVWEAKKGDSDGIFVQVEICVGMCTHRYTIDHEARGVQSQLLSTSTPVFCSHIYTSLYLDKNMLTCVCVSVSCVCVCVRECVCTSLCPVVKTPRFQCRAQVQSLVGKDPRMLHSMAKQKKAKPGCVCLCAHRHIFFKARADAKGFRASCRRALSRPAACPAHTLTVQRAPPTRRQSEPSVPRGPSLAPSDRSG